MLRTVSEHSVRQSVAPLSHQTSILSIIMRGEITFAVKWVSKCIGGKNFDPGHSSVFEGVWR